MSEQTPIWMWEIINVILPWKRPPTGGRKMSEPGDIARQKLHDVRWGPHIEDDVERQETLDDAIGAAIWAIAALEAKLEALERVRFAAAVLDRWFGPDGEASSVPPRAMVLPLRSALATAQKEQEDE